MPQTIVDPQKLTDPLEKFIEKYSILSKGEIYTSHPLAIKASQPFSAFIAIPAVATVTTGLAVDIAQMILKITLTISSPLILNNDGIDFTTLSSFVDNYLSPFTATATSYSLASVLTSSITKNNDINNIAKILPLFFGLETALLNYWHGTTVNTLSPVTDFMHKIFLKTGTVVIGIPLTLVVRIINTSTQLLDTMGIIENPQEVTPFKAIDAALHTAGGYNTDGFDRYPLHDACSLNQLDRVNELLKDLTTRNLIKALTESDIYHGGTSTAFTLAALHGHQQMVEKLSGLYAEPGININLSDADGKTPLMTAAAKGHLKVFDFLAPLYKQSNLDMAEQDKAGNTAIHYIATTSLYSNLSKEQLSTYQKIIHTLLANGVDINALNQSGQTALDILISKNASNVPAFQIASNIEESYVVGGLLAMDPNIETILDRIQIAFRYIKNKEVRDVTEIYKLFILNGAIPNLEKEHQLPYNSLDSCGNIDEATLHQDAINDDFI